MKMLVNMDCPTCGQSITLDSEVRVCPNCGATEIVIPKG